MNRRALGVVVAVAIAAAAFQPFYLRIYTMDRARLAASLAELPYRRLPGMRQFMLEVRARTREGDAIAIAAPASIDGRYLFVRARYLLGGRVVVPMAEGDKPLPQNLAMATHVVCFHCASTAPGFVEIWRGRDGVLMRRAR